MPGRFLAWEQCGLLAVLATDPALGFLTTVSGVTRETVPAAIDLAASAAWSDMTPTVVAQADLPGIVKTLISAIPDRTIDSALPTGPVLRRAVDKLDVTRLVRELDDPDRLQSAVRAAILRAARDEILGRLRPG